MRIDRDCLDWEPSIADLERDIDVFETALGAEGVTTVSPAAQSTASSPMSQAASVPLVNGVANVANNVHGNCRLCSLELTPNRRYVQCGGCRGVFHGDTLCLGVSGDELKVLLNNTNNSIKYNCCGCRNSRSSGGSGGVDSSNNAAITQMLVILGQLIKEVSGLKEKSGERPDNSDESNGGRAAGVNVRDDVVLDQIREIRERDKRKESIILRGFGNLSEQQLREKFVQVCEFLNVGRIEVTNLTVIGEGLYRANIVDREVRFGLLSQVSRLKGSQLYSSLYIQRDLTYKQRVELKARRETVRRGEVTERSNNINAVTNGGSFMSALNARNPVGTGTGFDIGSENWSSLPGRGGTRGRGRPVSVARVGAGGRDRGNGDRSDPFSHQQRRNF